MADESSPPQRSNTQLAGDRTDLAYERSRLAIDRTTMAYMRTSVSLIGFGFTLFKFFQYLSDTSGFEGLPVAGGRNLGVALLLLGALMLAMAIVQHMSFMRRLSSTSDTKFPISIALGSAMVLLVIGLAALANVIFRVGPM